MYSPFSHLSNYLWLHQECELTQLALLDITAFYPSRIKSLESFAKKVFLTCGDNLGEQTLNFQNRDRELLAGALRPETNLILFFLTLIGDKMIPEILNTTVTADVLKLQPECLKSNQICTVVCW